MAVIAKQLTDDDIANLAAWYASIKISVEPNP
jgi:cytochrome c553